MREAGTAHWTSPNTGATNSSGFTALPGGYRNYTITVPFKHINNFGYFWSASETSTVTAWNRILAYSSANVERFSGYEKTYGFSVRCLQN
jgi:uncharacterized protein (TIGR02145 family)